MNRYKLIIGLAVSSLLLAFTNAKVDIITDDFNSLFKIERSKDANQIFYDVRVNNDGEFDTKNPINVYWIKNTKGGKIEPLTWIQKKYAYGLKFLNITDDYATFKFVSYDKMIFTLKKTTENKFEVYTKHNNKLIKMDRIYIQLDGGSFWFPNIKDVKVFGEDATTGENISAVIQP